MRGIRWFIRVAKTGSAFIKDQKSVVAVIAFMCAIALYVAITQSVWLDESLSILFSSKSFGDIAHISATSDLHPPLYNMWLRVASFLFGTSPLAYRMWSIIAFVIFGLLLSNFLKEKGVQKKEIFWYVLLVMSSPFVLYYASEARSYMIVMLIALINSIAFDRLVDCRGSRIKSAFLYICTTIIGAYLFYPMLFLNVGQLVYIVIARRKQVWQWMWYWGISALFYAPWLIQVVLARMSEKPGHFLPILWWQIPAIIGVGFAGGRVAITDINHIHYYWPTALAIISYGVALLGIAQWRQIKEKSHVVQLIILSGVAGGVCLAISFARFPIFDPRYYAQLFPLFALLVIWSLEAYNRASRSWWKGVIALMLVSHIVLGGLYLIHPLFKREQWNVVVPRIEEEMRDSDVVMFIGPNSTPPTYITYQKKKVVFIETHPARAKGIDDYETVFQHIDDQLQNRNRLWYSSFLEWQKDPNRTIRSHIENTFMYVKTIGIFKVSFDLYERIN